LEPGKTGQLMDRDGWEEPQLDLGLAEDGVRSGDDEVTERDHLHCPPEAGSVDCGDHRHRKGGQREARRVEGGQHTVGLILFVFYHRRAGRETTSFARQHDRRQRFVGLELAEALNQLAEDRRVKHVDRRSVDHQVHHPLASHYINHGNLPSPRFYANRHGRRKTERVKS